MPIADILLPCLLVGVGQLAVCGHHRAHDDRLYPLLDFCGVEASSGQGPQQRRVGPLVALALAGEVAVGHEAGGVLVYGVVCEVHLFVGYVLVVGRRVLGGGQAAQPFPVHVYAQGRQAAQQHVDSEVELAALQQHRPLHVLLHHHLVLSAHSWDLSDVNAAALAVGVRLDYVEFVLAFLAAEGVVLIGQNPGFGVEGVLLGHGELGEFEVEGEQIFAAEFAAVGEVINFLVALQALHELLSDVAIHPNQEVIIEVVLLVVEFEVKVPVRQTCNDVILSFEHDSDVGKRVNFPDKLPQSKHKRLFIVMRTRSVALLTRTRFAKLAMHEVFVEIGQILRMLLLELHLLLAVHRFLHIQRLKRLFRFLFGQIALARG